MKSVVRVSIREAREILKVGEVVDLRSLKRAYLRQVKEHRPDRDPEGFGRVRQAYELLCAFASVGEDEAGSEPLQGRAIERLGLFVRHTPGAVESEVSAPTSENLGLPSIDGPAAASLAEEGVAEEGVAEAEASRKFRPCPSPETIRSEVQRGNLKRASRLALELLARRDVEHRATFPIAIELILKLFALGQDKRAKKLEVAVEQRLNEVGQKQRLTGSAASLWVYVGELKAVGVKLRPATRESLVAVILGHFHEEETRTTRALARLSTAIDEQPSIVNALERRAPSLHALAKQAIQRFPSSVPDGHRFRAQSGLGKGWVYFLLLAVLSMFRVCQRENSRSHSQSVPPAPWVAPNHPSVPTSAPTNSTKPS